MLTTGSNSRVVEVIKISLRGVQIARKQGLFADGDIRIRISSSSTARVTPARQPEESGGVQTRPRCIHHEHIGRGAFGNFAALIEQDHFVQTLLVRPFIARQIFGPGNVFGSGKFIGGVAAVGNHAQLHALAASAPCRR